MAETLQIPVTLLDTVEDWVKDNQDWLKPSHMPLVELARIQATSIMHEVAVKGLASASMSGALQRTMTELNRIRQYEQEELSALFGKDETPDMSPDVARIFSPLVS